MSLDNIQLPGIVLQDLYTNTLIDLKKNNGAATDTSKTGYTFLGSNNKNIAILVNSEEAIYLPDETLNFLMGILAACKLSMADVALVNFSKNKTLNYKDISSQFNARTVLFFNIKPGQIGLPLQFPQYQVQGFNNQVYLSAPGLDIIESDKAEKTRLWNCLKQVFSI